MARFFRNPLILAVLLLAVAEWAAGQRSPFRAYPNAGESLRNPTKIRGWPEYLAGGHPADQSLGVIISNSQGFGRELRDPNDLYVGRLRRRLAAELVPLTVENWAAPGIRTAEVELLSLQAVRRQVDVAVFVLHYDAFDPADDVTLDRVTTDIHLLAGRASNWAELRDTVVGGNTRMEDLLRRWCGLHSSLLRSRSVFMDAISPALSSAWRSTITGRDAYEQIRWFDTPERESPYPASKYEAWADPSSFEIKESTEVTDPRIRQRLATFKSFYVFFRERMAAADIKVVWVWMPLAVEPYEADAVERIRWFNAEATRLMEEDGIAVFDWTESFSHDQFLTLGHLRSEGHQRMADALYPVIVDELH